MLVKEWDPSEIAAREANHRMMNILARLLAMFRRDFSGFGDKRVRDAAAGFESKIMALAELLRCVSAVPGDGEVMVDHFFERLGRTISLALLQPNGVACEVSVQEGRLPAAVCERLALIVLELVINAAKYAFNDNQSAVIRIQMHRIGDAWSCVVTDNGSGMKEGATGTGLKIVDVLVQSIGARMSIDTHQGGTSVSIFLAGESHASTGRRVSA